jgi:hypothetical protein
MRTARELAKWSVLLPVLAALVYFTSPKLLGDPATGQAPTGPGYGQLIVGSDSVKSLTVVDELGKYRVFDFDFDQPGKSVSLPEGKYRLEEVKLTGSFNICRFTPEGEHWLQITSGKPQQLRIDDLLKPTVSVTRQGRLLELDYALLDADGAAYATKDTSNPPRFTVFKDGQEIGSGSFEYG